MICFVYHTIFEGPPVTFYLNYVIAEPLEICGCKIGVAASFLYFAVRWQFGSPKGSRE